jgi:hypothetical protein
MKKFCGSRRKSNAGDLCLVCVTIRLPQPTKPPPRIFDWMNLAALIAIDHFYGHKRDPETCSGEGEQQF